MHLGQIAAEQPGKAAVIMAGSGQTITFGELDAAANRLAHVLYDAGLRPGDHIAYTHSQWVPTMFIRLLKLPAQIRAKWDLSSLRYAVHAVPDPGQGTDDRVVGAGTARVFAHYKCPRSVDFRADLPRHPTGKLFKRVLREEY